MKKIILRLILVTIFGLSGPTVMADVTRVDLTKKSVTGDFNGDGFKDRVISDPASDRLFIWFGKGVGATQALTTVAEWSMYSKYFPGSGHSDPVQGTGAPVSEQFIRTEIDSAPLTSDTSFGFGSSMVVGDFNGDGVDDLAVGIPLSTVDGKSHAGKVAIIIGGSLFPRGSNDSFSKNTAGVSGDAETDGLFGLSLASGDFNGDGYADLAVGVPFEDFGVATKQGTVYLLYGKGTGLYSKNDVLRKPTSGVVATRGRPVADNANFGFSLAAGKFNGEACDSLAVGAPGQKVNNHPGAGSVYVFYAKTNHKLSRSRVTAINQDTGSVARAAHDWNRFGSSIGKLSRTNHDDLWISAPGEKHFSCVDRNQIFYHRLQGSDQGIDVFSTDQYYCGIFPPDFVEKNVGVISELNTVYGSIAFYFPNSDPSAMNLSVLIPGSNPDTTHAHIPCASNTTIYHRYSPWITEAYNFNETLIAPEFDNIHFGNMEICLNDIDADGDPELHYAVNGGYRGLWGEPIRADDWVNLIVDDLQKIGFQTGGTFKLFGHSAGAQFISRYLWKHAERATRVILESPSTYLKDDKSIAWHLGLKEMSATQWWPLSGIVDVYYDPVADMGQPDDRWPQIMARQIIIIVGENDGRDSDPEKDSCTRQDAAVAWQAQLNERYGNLPGTKKIEFCLYQGAEHNAWQMADEAASRLINDLTQGNCIKYPDTPGRCLNAAPWPYNH